jgi:Spy/CpxP family protein refolding chaperone
MRSALCIILLTAGCASGPKSTNDPAASNDVAEAAPAGDVAQVGAGEEEDESTADLAEHHRHHHHGGFAMFIAMSLDSLNTTPDQKAAIDKIRADLHAKMQPAHEDEKAVLLAVADGVAAGQIDHAKVDPLVAKVSTDSAGIHDAIGDSLVALHDVLTPPQRQALADKLSAHFEVWHHTNAAHEGKERDEHGGQLGKLAKELELTPQQVDTIRSSFASSMGKAQPFDRSKADEHVKAFAAAFTADKFDPKSLTLAGELNAKIAGFGVTRTVKFYEAVTPALTPPQRTKLADEIRRHANFKRNGEEK